MSRRAVARDKRSEPSPLSAPIPQPDFRHIGEVLPVVIQKIVDASLKYHHSKDRGLRRAA